MKLMFFSIAIFYWKDNNNNHNISFIYNRLYTCYCVCMVFATSALRYVTPASRYQSRSSMYIQGLIPWNTTKLAKAVQIDNDTVACISDITIREYSLW